MGKIGLQLYSVRDELEKDFLGGLRRIGQFGYEGVQFAGFYNTAAIDLKRVLDESGLVAAGSHMGFNSLQGEQLETTLEYNHKIKNNLIICPSLPKEHRKTEDDYKLIAERFNQIGEICKKNGFEFAYHNHDFEFLQVGNDTGFDIIFNNTDPNLVKIELDCYWVSFVDLNPENYIKKHGSRVVSLHIKDMKQQNGSKRSIEIGDGVLDITGLIKAGNEAGTKWFIVEQEHFDGDTMESSEKNIKRLKSLILV